MRLQKLQQHIQDHHMLDPLYTILEEQGYITGVTGDDEAQVHLHLKELTEGDPDEPYVGEYFIIDITGELDKNSNGSEDWEELCDFVNTYWYDHIQYSLPDDMQYFVDEHLLGFYVFFNEEKMY